MCYYTHACTWKSHALKNFSKKIKKNLKNFEKSVDKSFSICYIWTVLSNKASTERKFVRTIYILIGTGKNTKFLPIPSFLNNEISQAIEQGYLQRLYLS